MLGLISSALSVLYLVMFFDVIVRGGKEIIRKHSVLEGKLLFLIFSFFVYYKHFHFGIPFWDAVFTQPVNNALGMFDAFLKVVSAGKLSISPPNGYVVIFENLLPASFVYYFIDYWFSYAFMDKRISKMVSLFAVFIFLSQGYSLGLISSMLVPVFFPIFGIPLLEMTFNTIPIPDFLTSAGMFGRGNLAGVVEWTPVLFLAVIALFFFVLIYFASKSIINTDKKNDLLQVLILLVFIGIAYVGMTQNGTYLQMVGFVFVASLLGLLGDVMVLLSILLFSSTLFEAR